MKTISEIMSNDSVKFLYNIMEKEEVIRKLIDGRKLDYIEFNVENKSYTLRYLLYVKDNHNSTPASLSNHHLVYCNNVYIGNLYFDLDSNDMSDEDKINFANVFVKEWQKHNKK